MFTQPPDNQQVRDILTRALLIEDSAKRLKVRLYRILVSRSKGEQPTVADADYLNTWLIDLEEQLSKIRGIA